MKTRVSRCRPFSETFKVDYFQKTKWGHNFVVPYNFAWNFINNSPKTLQNKISVRLHGLLLRRQNTNYFLQDIKKGNRSLRLKYVEILQQWLVKKKSLNITVKTLKKWNCSHRSVLMIGLGITFKRKKISFSRKRSLSLQVIHVNRILVAE